MDCWKYIKIKNKKESINNQYLLKITNICK